MAEAVLNSPGPNSPLNGNSKPMWSDPPSRRTSTCSVHSDTGKIDGILHDSTGIGLTVPPPILDQIHGPHQLEEIWKNDHEQISSKPTFPMSPVNRSSTNGSQHIFDTYHFMQYGGDQTHRQLDGPIHIPNYSVDSQWK